MQMWGCRLVRPSLGLLPAYKAALNDGWSPSSLKPIETAAQQLREIESNRVLFVRRLEESSPHVGTTTLANGLAIPRLPGYTRWLWDRQFCGTINLRWQPGTTALPPDVMGHIGFSVVPWRQNRGNAKRALALLLPEARARGLAFVELTTDPENVASQRVILANGGLFIERFRRSRIFGGSEALRFKIVL